MCCVLIAVLQLWLKESDEYEQLMGRTADPRLEKVLALIDKGVPPQTALNRHGNPVSLEHLCRDCTFCPMRWASSGVSVRTQLDEQASLAHGDGWIGHVGGLSSRETGQSASRGARCRPALHDGRRCIGPILNYYAKKNRAYCHRPIRPCNRDLYERIPHYSTALAVP
jgi:hypothetical protein